MAKKPSPVMDPTLPRVLVEVNGSEYFLCFDFNAIVQAETLTGLNLLNALDFSNVNALTLRALLYSALLKLQPNVTLDEAGMILTLGRGKVTTALVKAFTESQPEVDDDSKNVEKPEQ
jgi:hypothetical protein